MEANLNYLWQLIQDKNPNFDKQLLMIPPVDLDQLLRWKHLLLNKGGNDLLTVPLFLIIWWA